MRRFRTRQDTDMLSRTVCATQNERAESQERAQAVIDTRRSGKGKGEHKRCYSCSKLGHIGRDRPVKRPHVGQIGDTEGRRNACEKRERISDNMRGAGSLRVRGKQSEE